MLVVHPYSLRPIVSTQILGQARPKGPTGFWMSQEQLGLDKAFTDMGAEGLRFTLQGALNLQGGNRGSHRGLTGVHRSRRS